MHHCCPALGADMLDELVLVPTDRNHRADPGLRDLALLSVEDAPVKVESVHTSRLGTPSTRPDACIKGPGLPKSDRLTQVLEPEVAAGGVLQGLGGADVALDEGGESLVPGLGGDPVQGDAGDGGAGGVTGAKRVGGDPFGGQSGGPGALAEHDRDRLAGDRRAGDRPVPHAGEHPALLGAAIPEPGVECGDRVGGDVLAVDDGDDLAIGVMVGLGPADGQNDSTGLELDVDERQRRQLGAAQRGGESQQDQSGVPGTQGGAAVDGLDDGRMSSVPRGRAWRRGAAPMMRRSPRRTWRTPSVRIGSGVPCVRCGRRWRRRRGRWCRRRVRRRRVR